MTRRRASAGHRYGPFASVSAFLTGVLQKWSAPSERQPSTHQHRSADVQWVFTINPMWMRDRGVARGGAGG
jgi:hypothetical protein